MPRTESAGELMQAFLCSDENEAASQTVVSISFVHVCIS